jgi:hypothetical protein
MSAVKIPKRLAHINDLHDTDSIAAGVVGALIKAEDFCPRCMTLASCARLLSQYCFTHGGTMSAQNMTMLMEDLLTLTFADLKRLQREGPAKHRMNAPQIHMTRVKAGETSPEEASELFRGMVERMRAALAADDPDKNTKH